MTTITDTPRVAGPMVAGTAQQTAPARPYDRAVTTIERTLRLMIEGPQRTLLGKEPVQVARYMTTEAMMHLDEAVAAAHNDDQRFVLGHVRDHLQETADMLATLGKGHQFQPGEAAAERMAEALELLEAAHGIFDV